MANDPLPPTDETAEALKLRRKKHMIKYGIPVGKPPDPKDVPL